MAEPIVIVGASLAGLRAAQAVRAGGHDGDLVVVGAEEHLPYTRPPLSKELLRGVQEPADCALPGSDALQGVDWRLGTPAAALDRADKQIVLADGSAITYNKAILATGCRARTWQGPGAGLDGVFTLRDLGDALALRTALEAGGRLVVVGAGFVGCEVAATAAHRGVQVTIVDVAPHPMLPLGPELGGLMADLHRAHGIALRLGVGVRALRGPGQVTSVELQDGTSLEADAVLVATGAIPNVEWLAGSGLTIDRGVVADATLTSVDDPDVLVAGDLACWPSALAGGAIVRVEHWTNAAEQGTLAGRNALIDDPAQRTALSSVPMFWSDQHDRKVQAVGLPGAADEITIAESSPDGDRLVAIGARDGRLVAAIAFNAAKRLGWYRRQLAAGARAEQVLAAAAADPAALGAATAPAEVVN
jgi:3-phenylpropionate/trans-cinnamate dioxygenase ferredoxin reductase subunit